MAGGGPERIGCAVTFTGSVAVTARLAESYPALPDAAGFARRYQTGLKLNVLSPDEDAAPTYGEYDHWEHNAEYREQPIATLKRYCELGDDWADVVAGCRQDNFVFIRSEDA